MNLKAAFALLLAHYSSFVIGARTGAVTDGLILLHELLETECGTKTFKDTGK